MNENLRAWYLRHFHDGRSLEGKALRNHLVVTLSELRRLADLPAEDA